MRLRRVAYGGVLQITRYLEATNLKYYFNINNSYVPNKLKVILCPILHKVPFQPPL